MIFVERGTQELHRRGDGDPRRGKHRLERRRKIRHFLAFQEQTRFVGHDLEINAIVLSEIAQDPDELIQIPWNEILGFVLAELDLLHDGRIADDEIEFRAGGKIRRLDGRLLEMTLLFIGPGKHFDLNDFARFGLVLVENHLLQAAELGFLGSPDVEIDAVYPHILELVVDQIVDGRRHECAEARHRRAVISRIEVFEMDALSVVEKDVAVEIEGQVSGGPLFRCYDRREGHVDEGRAHDLVVDDAEIVFLLRAGTAFELDVDGDHLGHPAKDSESSGGSVLDDLADNGAARGKLEGTLEAGDDGQDIGFGHGVFHGAEAVERMAESQDVIAVDMGDGSHRRQIEIPRDELDADRVARAEGGFVLGPRLRFSGRAGTDGLKAGSGEERFGLIEGLGRKSAENERDGQRGEGIRSRRARRFQGQGRSTPGKKDPSGVIMTPEARAGGVDEGRPASVFFRASISAMGVMPAMGSLENG